MCCRPSPPPTPTPGNAARPTHRCGLESDPCGIDEHCCPNDYSCIGGSCQERLPYGSYGCDSDNDCDSTFAPAGVTVVCRDYTCGPSCLEELPTPSDREYDDCTKVPCCTGTCYPGPSGNFCDAST